MRTLPAAANPAASVRVRQNRACQSHLSRRRLGPWKPGSLTGRSFLEFEIAQRGEGRIRMVAPHLLRPAAPGRPLVLGTQLLVEAKLAILLHRAETECGDYR